MNVKLTKQQKQQSLNANDIAAIMQQVLMRENKIRRNQEHFWVVGLNQTNKLLFVELVSLGAVNRLQVSPPEVFRMAIYKLAVKMVLIHNHPSGHFHPSEPDIDYTDRLLKVGEMINIEVLDHIIITENDWFSFEVMGIMEKLRDSDTYRMPNLYSKKLEAMRIKAEQKQALKDNNITIAQKMIKDKVPIDTIITYTGLKKKEIEKLMK